MNNSFSSLSSSSCSATRRSVSSSARRKQQELQQQQNLQPLQPVHVKSKRRASMVSHSTATTIDSSSQSSLDSSHASSSAASYYSYTSGSTSQSSTYFIPGITAKARCLEDDRKPKKRDAADIYRRTAALTRDRRRQSQQPQPPSLSGSSQQLQQHRLSANQRYQDATAQRMLSGAKTTQKSINAEAEMQEAFERYDQVVESIKKTSRRGRQRDCTTSGDQASQQQDAEGDEEFLSLLKQLRIPCEKQTEEANCTKDQLGSLRNMSGEYRYQGEEKLNCQDSKRKQTIAKTA